jgi:hypothetical protein
MTYSLDISFKPFEDFTRVEVFDYYDGPRFFSVKDLVGQLFLVYWIDETEAYSSWLYVRISAERYTALKRGYISVASALSQPEDGFAFVLEGESVKKIPASSIHADWLPVGDYRLALQAPSLPQREITAVDLSKRVQRQVLDIAFSKLSNVYELGARKFGRLLEAFQGTVEALACGEDGAVRRIPDDIKNRSELMTTALFASSFGVRLQTKGTDLFASDDTAKALETLGQLIIALEAPNAIAAELRKFNILARSRFKHLLSVLVEAQVSLAADWGNPDGRSIQANASFDQISLSLCQLQGTDEATEQTLDRRGRLVGVDVRGNFFAFVDEEDHVIKGELAPELRAEHFAIPSEVVVTVRETCEVDPLTDKERWTYVLLAVVVAPPLAATPATSQ